jgi:alkanesulfonate monooxygenase SsuD/methylene tetrahydromethanopterin reductase-like flavin-dependent oxidoreductase (luciferase family)
MVSIKDCGLMLEPQLGMSVEDVIEWARYAERGGYGYIMRSDHLSPTSRGEIVDSPECWITLGLIAANTKNIRFGPLVSPIGFRNPALLARMACTLHAYADGRLLLGVGAGWLPGEFAAQGYDFPKFRVRREQLLEAIKIIRPLTEGKSVDYNGRYFSAHTTCLPKPKGKVHLIIGGKNRAIIETSAAYADEWNTGNTTLDTFIDAKKKLDTKTSGRRIAISRMSSFIIGEKRSDLEPRILKYSKPRGAPAAAEKLRDRGVLCGTVDEFVAQLNTFIEAGVQKFYFQVLDPQDKPMLELLTQTLKNAI